MFGKIDRLWKCAVLSCLVAAPAGAQCQPFICYVDLGPSPAFICPNSAVYPPAGRRLDPIVITPDNPGCDVNFWKAAVVQVDVPAECTGVLALVEYSGVPVGWTVNIGDSDTNNGFGGDAASQPTGQNAEVQVLNQTLSAYSAADNPAGVDTIASQHLALRDGALKFVVEDQFVSWGQPFSNLASPQLEQLFFLPATPPAGGNRTIYIGLNRVISPVNAQNLSRNGCGARHAILWVK